MQLDASFPLFSSTAADDPSSSSSSVADPSGPEAPCFVDDVLAALRDSIGDDGQLTKQSLSVFGLCSLPAQRSGAPLLLDLARRTGRKQPLGLELLRPVGGGDAAAGRTGSAGS